ncbi:hypothetical protein GCM10023086_36320 [Streptomyces venetus]|uniref:Uncharacterized protein n=1 Tax=Streptomyces venetus TaxID=1701086 RepID=A0ABP8G0H5_9ACTN
MAFQACRYAALSRDLPALIGDAGRAVHAALVGEQGEAHSPRRGNPQTYPWGKALAGVRRQTDAL